jgi:hypothetical protein
LKARLLSQALVVTFANSSTLLKPTAIAIGTDGIVLAGDILTPVPKEGPVLYLATEPLVALFPGGAALGIIAAMFTTVAGLQLVLYRLAGPEFLTLLQLTPQETTIEPIKIGFKSNPILAKELAPHAVGCLETGAQLREDPAHARVFHEQLCAFLREGHLLNAALGTGDIH